MSIASTTARISYTLTAADQLLTVPFYFLEASHLEVLVVGSPPVTLALTTDYTVNGAGSEGGGSIKLTGAGTDIADEVVILRNVPATQLVDYVFNDRFPAEVHEKALDKLTMLAQQRAEGESRALRFEKGETLDGTLSKTSRTSKALAFDANGAPTFITAGGVLVDTGNFLAVTDVASLAALPVTSLTAGRQALVAGYASAGDGGGGVFRLSNTSDTAVAGMVVASPTAGWQWKRVYSGAVNVRWFGAKGDGATNDETAIETAWAFVNSVTNGYYFASAGLSTWEIQGAALYFPAGKYVYNGSGLTRPASSSKVITMLADAPGTVEIVLDSASDWVTWAADVNTVTVKNLQFTGGVDVFKFASAANNVRKRYTFENVSIQDFTGVGIGHISVDMPYWDIQGCVFDPGNYTTAICVALNGLTDGCVIKNNAFLSGKAGLKLGYGGNNAYVEGNDFIRYGAHTGPVASVWIVPRSTSINSGAGLFIGHNKFGNENMNTNDYHVLIADETGAGDFCSNLWSTSISAGFVYGITTRENLFNFPTGQLAGAIYSYTPEVWASSFSDLIGGDPPSCFTYSAAPAQGGNDRFRYLNRFNFRNLDGIYHLNQTSHPATNIDDVLGMGAGDEWFVQRLGVGVDTSYVLIEDQTAWSVANATSGSATDSLGGSTAQEVTATNAGIVISNSLAAPAIAGKPVWFEFEAKQGSSMPYTEAVVEMRLPASAEAPAFRRRIKLSTEWKRYRFFYTPRNSSDALRLVVVPQGYSSGVVEKIQLGFTHVYQANEPVGNHRSYHKIVAVHDGVAEPATISGKAQIYVDLADGDLKVKFGDGTVKTIVVDT